MGDRDLRGSVDDDADRSGRAWGIVNLVEGEVCNRDVVSRGLNKNPGGCRRTGDSREGIPDLPNDVVIQHDVAGAAVDFYAGLLRLLSFGISDRKVLDQHTADIGRNADDDFATAGAARSDDKRILMR